MNFIVEVIDNSTPSSVDVSEVVTYHMFYKKKKKIHVVVLKLKWVRK